MTARAHELPDRAAAALSLEEIYDRHFDFVWRSLRSLGVAESAIDDAVQELFVVVHRRLADFEGRSSLKSWLFGIARNIALRELRTRQRKVRDADLAAEPAAPGADPCDIAERAEAAELLVRLLHRLDDDKRAIFVLVEIEQMTVPDAAAALAINVNTAYSRLRLARRRFQEAAARFCRTEGAADD